MRLKDAFASLQLGQKSDQKEERKPLCTAWSEEATDGSFAVPLSEHPRPQMARASWLCLNGWWDYAIRSDGERMGEPDGKILVPFSPESRRSQVNRTLKPGEILWYRRTISSDELSQKAGFSQSEVTGASEQGSGRRVILHFDAVDERCAVWWNKEKIGTHRNGYLPFSFDITDRIRMGDNLLEIAVRDDTDQGSACRGKQTLQLGGMYYHAQSGIWQTVWLEIVPRVHIADLRITPLPSEEAVELTLLFEGVVEMDVSVQIGEDVEDTGNLAGENTLETKLSRLRVRSGESFRLSVASPRLWSPEDPFLYLLRIKAGEDRIESYFAMREFGIGKDADGRPRLLLNGRPYFFHGVLDQGYWPESLMTPPADEAMVYDIEKMKSAGFNMLRKHLKIEPARWYYHCDRIGMVVWQDMVSGGSPVNKLLVTYLPTLFPAIGRHLNDRHYALLSRKDKKARTDFGKDLLAMVRLLYNVPCIGLWTIFNEGWGQFDALRLATLVKEADPTRPVNHASGWFDQKGPDIRSVHNYFRKLEVEEDERPFVISEYGGINCSISGHVESDKVYGYQKSDAEDFPRKFASLMEEILALEEKGLSGAVYTQLSDVEEETNGLMTYDRKVMKI